MKTNNCSKSKSLKYAFVFQSNFVHKTQVPFLSVVLFIVLVIYDVFYLHILNNFMIFFLYNKDYIALDLLSTTLTTKWSLNPTDLLLSTNETNPVFSRVYFHWWFLHVVPFFFFENVSSLSPSYLSPFFLCTSASFYHPNYAYKKSVYEEIYKKTL